MRNADSRWFYVCLAALFAAVTLLSFVPTYWGPVAAGRLEGGDAALHAVAMVWSGLWVAGYSINLQSSLGYPAAARVQTAIPRILFARFAPPGSPQRPGLGEPAPMLVGLPGVLIVDLLLVAAAPQRGTRSRLGSAR
jgi:hypothetical protein